MQNEISKKVEVKPDYTHCNDGLVVYNKDSEQLGEMVAYRMEQSEVLVRSVLNHLNVKDVFEVSCGLGTNLVVFRKNGVSIGGSEYGYMLSQVLPEIRDVVVEIDLSKPFMPTKQSSVVLCTEVLEHIDEEELATSIFNLKSLAKDYLVVTVPLIHRGYEACADHILWEGEEKTWPRKLSKDELWLNPDGTASLGHVTMATEKWWEDKFLEFGLCRNQEKEIEILRDFEKGGIAPFYNLFILTHKGSDRSSPSGEVKSLAPGIMKHFVNDMSQYSSLIVLEKIEKNNFQVDPGEMFFVHVNVMNASSRVFNCDPGLESRVRMGVRFRGHSFTTENLPIYLKTNLLKPGECSLVKFQIRSPYNPGPYLCEISLVEEGRTWFCDALDDPGNALRFSMFVKA